MNGRVWASPTGDLLTRVSLSADCTPCLRHAEPGLKQRGEVALSFFFVLYFLTFNFYLAALRMLSRGTGGAPMVNTSHCLIYSPVPARNWWKQCGRSRAFPG